MAGPPALAVTEVLLVRHGQSTWNAERRWQGRADPDLSPTGHDQAQRAAARIGFVEVVAASPLARAHRTAVVIADALGIGPILRLDGLMERDVGGWQGRTVAEIEADSPGAVAAGRWPPGWEPDEAVAARAFGALDALVSSFPGQAVLAVSHGGVLRALARALAFEAGRVPNLAGLRLRASASGGTETFVYEALEWVDLLDEAGGPGGPSWTEVPGGPGGPGGPGEEAAHG
jgi:probable phosphoglycerate mutase